MILTTPLIERLASRGPVHVVATPENAGILANHPAVASVIVFDKRGADRGVGGVRRVARAARAIGAQTAYMAQGSLRTATIARLAGIPERIGFNTSPGRVLYSRQVPFEVGLHHTQRLWQLASPAGAAEHPPLLRPTLHPGTSDHAQVDALLVSYGITSEEQIIAFAPGSVWATKRWPFYDALAVALTERVTMTPVRLMVLGAAADGPLAAAIASAVASRGGRPVLDATGRLSLLGSAALIARARVLVTNDSAPLHLASAMNTPTIALFGPTVPAFGFGPLAEMRRVVEREALACRPCGAHGPQQCPLGHWQCMRAVTVPTVMDVAVPFLGE